MTTVTVDLADLERLVMTTGAIKIVEQAIQQRRNDPFVRQHLDFTEAHDRLATAMRNVQRSKASGSTVVAFDGPLDDEEVKALRIVSQVPENWFHEIGTREKVGDYVENGTLSVFDRLAAKGMCVIGQLCEGAVFSGERGPQLRPIRGYGVKMTDRGRAKLAEIETEAAMRMSEEELLSRLDEVVSPPVRK